jgi:hypothetical protein
MIYLTCGLVSLAALLYIGEQYVRCTHHRQTKAANETGYEIRGSRGTRLP